MILDLKRTHVCLPTDTAGRLRWETRASISTLVRAGLEAFEDLLTKSTRKAQQLIQKHPPIVGVARQAG